MNPISAEHKKMLVTIGRQYPEFVGFVKSWREQELERMSQGSQENFGVSKGRVQVLTELQQKISPVS